MFFSILVYKRITEHHDVNSVWYPRKLEAPINFNIGKWYIFFLLERNSWDPRSRQNLNDWHYWFTLKWDTVIVRYKPKFGIYLKIHLKCPLRKIHPFCDRNKADFHWNTSNNDVSSILWALVVSRIFFIEKMTKIDLYINITAFLYENKS